MANLNKLVNAQPHAIHFPKKTRCKQVVFRHPERQPPQLSSRQFLSAKPTEFKKIKLRHYDPEQLREVLNGAKLEHQILAREDCTADVSQLNSSQYSLSFGHYAFPVFIRGCFPVGRICIGMSWGRQTRSWVNGFHVDYASIQIYAEDVELLYRAGSCTQWSGFTISRERLQVEAFRRLGRELSLPKSGTWNVTVPLPFAQRLMRTVHLVGKRRVACDPGEEGGEDLLIGAYLETIASANDTLAKAIEQRVCHRLDVIRRADAFMRQHLTEAYSSDRICRAIGVSERNLQLQFKQALGASPKAWFRQLALHRSHAELQQRPLRKGLVTEIALACGFEHLGRFSQAYRELFGETPSALLLRRTRRVQASN